jgi:hypothetical protein
MLVDILEVLGNLVVFGSIIAALMWFIVKGSPEK